MKKYTEFEENSGYWKHLTDNGNKPVPKFAVFKETVPAGVYKIEVPIIKVTGGIWKYETFMDRSFIIKPENKVK